MSDLDLLLSRLQSPDRPLTGAADDSRQVQPGDLFLAYPGHSADGRQYIAAALAKGAAAVLWEEGDGFSWNPAWAVPHLGLRGLRQLAGPLAHLIHRRPSEQLSLIAITGTNGKTTISQWLGRSHPARCAMIGTLGAGFSGALQDTGFTTPEATTLMRYLADFQSAGARACALEASSIGIAEGRMNGARVDVAVFTNFTRDHLDYHGTMAEYAAAKARLFAWPRLRLAVVNLDDELGRRLALETTALKVVGYTLGSERSPLPATIRAEDLRSTGDGQAFTLATPHGRAEVRTAVLGRYNIANLLAVAAVLQDAGLTVDDIAARLAALPPPAGRMERYGHHGEPLVAVDYAHTPDALENALIALRPQAEARGGQLFCVFGCGGERDRGKRPEMGRIATRLADRVWLTNDNPRSEDPAEILAEIQGGAPAAEVEADRRLAIRRAVLAADAADVILVAGKGHESYQDIAGIRYPFADGEEVRAALAARQEGRHP